MILKGLNSRGRHFGEILLPAIVLWVIFLLTYVRFYEIAYLGFHYDGTSGEVVEVYAPSANLNVGDRILAVDDKDWQDLRTQLSVHPLARLQSGDLIQLTIERAGQQTQLAWQIPGATVPEVMARLLNTWPVSYIFWMAGTLTLALVRPKDKRWALLAAFNYITAIWFIAGGISRFGVFGSQIILRSGVWFSLPIYLHLHWILPRQIGQTPRFFWPVMYGLAAVMSLGHLLDLLPMDLYLSGFLVAIAGSIGLLLYRFFFRPAERQEISLILLGAGVALMPAIALGFSRLQADPSVTVPGYLLSLAALPGAYLYVVMRRRLGDLEFRANRLISLYLFLMLLVTFTLLLLPVATYLFPGLSGAGGVVMLTVMLTATFSIFGFQRFQTIVERRVLGIPEAPQRLLEDFAGRLSTSFSRPHLVSLLTNEVLPALLIRQSVLLDFSAQGPGRVVYLQGLPPGAVPSLAQQKRLAAHGDAWSLPAELLSGRAGWPQVSLLLQVGGEPRGLWLLGRKDPDDYYSQAEVRLLRSLADQMAIALINISQAQDLRALYQANVQRQEVERVHLARELHDDTLARIGDLAQAATLPKPFVGKLEELVDQIRAMINGLRPPLLDQGLFFALLEYSDQLAHKAGKVKVELDVPLSYQRFDPVVEQHLFRILQQAAENALKHARARRVRIRGHIDGTGVDLMVEDDGVGLRLKDTANLSEFLSQGHFGLAGMQERASMIGASLSVEAAPQKGTRIGLAWRPPAAS